MQARDSFMSYQPSSMVLFLTNCSLTKALGGGAGYDAGQAITSVLPNSLGERLLKRRASVFQLVKNATDFEWQGTSVSELAFNRELTLGPDLGGRRTAAYLPALDRYEGRFFQALGAEGKQRLVESEHHTLFLSGLYGLLRPMEPVQLYSCPLAPSVAESWRKEALLTDILCDYIKRFGIARIIDMTAIDAYRRLIDWEKIAATKTDVLHCFDEMAAGDYALTSFGKCLAAELLGLSEDGIVDLPSEHQIETVILRSLRETVPGLPEENASEFAVETVPRLPAESVEVKIAEETPENLPTQPPAPARLPWQLAYTSRFQKDVRGNMGDFTRISQATLDICRDPTTPRKSIKRLQGQQHRWRYRLGDYRLVYWLDKREDRVVLERFGHRRDVYKGLDR